MMSNNKQSSSVDWLYNKMYEHRGNITIEEFEQAKAMHKEEIEEAYDIGKESTINARLSQNSYRHYNETFGGNNEQQ